MKLQTALKGLIYEIASLDSIVDAIKRRQVVVIYYDGDEPGGRGLREIEPVCLGVSKAGNKVLRVGILLLLIFKFFEKISLIIVDWIDLNNSG